MKTIIKTTLSLGLLALLSGCASNNGVDEYTLDSVNSNWYNTSKMEMILLTLIQAMAPHLTKEICKVSSMQFLTLKV